MTTSFVDVRALVECSTIITELRREDFDRDFGYYAILLGDKPSTALARQFYVRALAGDAQDILDDAGAYVRRNGLVRYCDDVLLPAIALGAADWRSGEVGAKRQERVRTLMVNLVESVRGGRPRFKPSIVEASLGLQLRKLREARLGP